MKNSIQIDDRNIVLHVFPAFEGFELNRRYRTDYKTQSDSRVREEFALHVLAFAEYNGVRLEGVEKVNEVCGNWKNLQTIFYAVLEFNEVDIQLDEEKAKWFEYAGTELAVTFIAEATKLMSPFLQSVSGELQDG